MAWQFNFKFSLTEDMYAQDSIDLLKDAGIDFAMHESDGIDVTYVRSPARSPVRSPLARRLVRPSATSHTDENLFCWGLGTPHTPHLIPHP